MREFFRQYFIHNDCLRAATFETHNLRAVIPPRNYFVDPVYILLPGIVLVALILLAGVSEFDRYTTYLVAAALSVPLYALLAFGFFKWRTNPKFGTTLMVDKKGGIGRAWIYYRNVDWDNVKRVSFVHTIFASPVMPVKSNLLVELKSGSTDRFFVPDLTDDEYETFSAIPEEISKKHSLGFTSER